MSIISNTYEYGKTVAKKIAVESLKMKEDSRGTAFIMYIVGAVIAFYVLAALVPSAITEFKGANTTAFSAGELGMWGLITLMFIVGLVLMFVPGGAKGRR